MGETNKIGANFIPQPKTPATPPKKKTQIPSKTTPKTPEKPRQTSPQPTKTPSSPDIVAIDFTKDKKAEGIFQNMFSNEIPEGAHDYEFYAYAGLGRAGLDNTQIKRTPDSIYLTSEYKGEKFNITLSKTDQPGIINVALGEGSFNGKILARSPTDMTRVVIADEIALSDVAALFDKDDAGKKGKSMIIEQSGKYPVVINTAGMDEFAPDLSHRLDSLTFKLKLKK